MVGLGRARVVEMPAMPERIAVLHSFVGLAAVLVGWNSYLDVEASASAKTDLAGPLLSIHHGEVFVGVFIGAVTFTGSIVAWGKLSARFKSAPLVLPGKNALNVGALAVFAVLTVWFVIAPTLGVLIAVTVVALALGADAYRDIDHFPDGGYYPTILTSVFSLFGRDDYRDYYMAYGWQG